MKSASHDHPVPRPVWARTTLNLARKTFARIACWLPLAVVLVLSGGSVATYVALAGKQNQQITETVRAGATSARSQLWERMGERVRALADFSRMSRRWAAARDQTAGTLWHDEALGYIHGTPGVVAVKWLRDDGSTICDAYNTSVQAKIDPKLEENPCCKAVMHAHGGFVHLGPSPTGVFPIYPGTLGFAVFVPVAVDARLDGYLEAVFDARTFVDGRYLPSPLADGEAITVSEGGREFFARDASEASPRAEWTVEEELHFPGPTLKAVRHGPTWTFTAELEPPQVRWDIRVWPTPALVARLESPFPRRVLLGGVLGAMLLGAVCWLAQRFQAQAAAMARMNAELKAALDEVETLEGLLPICAYCKRVRDDTGYWNQIDSYISKHTKASLSHGYCPECAAKAFTDMGFEVPESVQVELARGNFE